MKFTNNKSFSLIEFIENTKLNNFSQRLLRNSENELRNIFELNYKKKIFVSVGFTP